MKTSSIICILSLISIAFSIPVEGITNRAPQVLGLDFEVKRNLTSIFSSIFTKRSSAYSNELIGKGSYYLTYILLGSDEQKIGVDIDTGSSDLWVPSSNTSAGSWQQHGVYNPSGSYTHYDTGIPFKINYYDGTSSSGQYVKDSFKFADGSGELTNFQFASVSETTVSQGGVLGLSVKALEQVGSSPQYNNLPFAMKSAGLIEYASYSIYFDSAEATSGTLLFGGVDTSKYDQSTLHPFSFNGTAITALLGNFTINGMSTPTNLDMILDTGSTYSFFPDDIHEELVEQLGGDGSTINGYNKVSCDPIGNLSYTFTSSVPGDSLTIDIPLSDIVVSDSQNCYLTIRGGINILGDDFLKHVYLGVNLDTSYVWLAKPLYTTSSTVVQFPVLPRIKDS